MADQGTSAYDSFSTDLVTPTNGVVPTDQGKSEVESIFTSPISNFATTDQMTFDPLEKVIPANPHITYYKLRGYYVSGAVFEVWVTTNSTSLTPPSNHSLIDTSIIATWIL